TAPVVFAATFTPVAATVTAASATATTAQPATFPTNKTANSKRISKVTTGLQQPLARARFSHSGENNAVSSHSRGRTRLQSIAMSQSPVSFSGRRLFEPVSAWLERFDHLPDSTMLSA